MFHFKAESSEINQWLQDPLSRDIFSIGNPAAFKAASML
jgi:hypothetical protein